MGRNRVGKTPGDSRQRCAPGCQCGRHRGNAGSFSVNGANLAAGIPSRFKPKYPDPSPGDRFGELTVLGMEVQVRGACPTKMARVQCSCEAPPHLVYTYNLRKGTSTRCNLCAKKQSGYWRKKFHGYADIVPSEHHRVRLLNRISACISRCHNPKDRGFPNYGGRGVFVFATWRESRKEFLQHLVTLKGWDQAHLELDRIDVDKGYEPGNIRFVSHAVNQGNRRKVRAMQERIIELEQENARLRSALSGAA